MRFLGPLLVLSLLTTACTTLEPVAAPEVSLVNLRFENATLFETTAVFTLRLSNGNAFPVAVDGGIFTMALNGVRIGRGMSSERVALDRLSTATIEVPVHVSNLALVFRARDVLQRGTVSYEVASRLHLAGDHAGRTAETECRGELTLPAAQVQQISPLLPLSSAGAASGL